MLHPTHETEYRAAIDAAGRPYNTVTGTITFSDNTTLDITDEILSENPISTSRQCVDNDQLMFGGVFTDVLKLNLITDVDRYKFFDAKIELFYEIEITIQEGTDEPTYQMEQVPIGVFYVADADRPNDDEVNLTAYDSMTLLDKELDGVQISGTPWLAFQQISLATGYPLAFEESDLSDFVNTEYQISGSEDNGMKTYRDVVKEICQLIGCFAHDDRTGQLAVKKFSTTADITLDTSNWYEMVPADYKSSFIGISLKSLKGTYNKVTQDPTAIGTIMTIDDAPAWDYGTDEAQETKLDNLYSLLRAGDPETAVIEYTPATIDMPSDATFECGDMLALIPMNGDPNDSSTWIYTIITSIEWALHEGMKIESVGVNPYLTSSQLTEDEGGRILNQAVAKSKMQFVTFTNAAEIEIGDEEYALIGTGRFTPTNNTTALFVGTILVDVAVEDETETDTEEVEVPVTPYYNDQETTITDINGNPVTLKGTSNNTYTYYRDGVCTLGVYYTISQNSNPEYRVPNDEEPYLAVEAAHNGEHIITVTYAITNLAPNIRYEFNIYLSVNGGTVTVPIRTMQATLVGQEIDELARFNGEIRVEDEEPTGRFTLGDIDVTTLYEGLVSLEHPEGLIETASDNVSLYNIDSISITPLYEGTGQLIPHVLFYSLYISAENDDTLVTEDDIAFETEGMPSAGT